MTDFNQTEKNIQQIVSLLRNSYEGILKRKRLTTFCFLGGILLAGLGLLVLIESSFYLSATEKSVLLSLIIVGALAAGWYISRKGTLPGFSSYYEKLLIKNNRKELLSAVDLYLDDKQKHSRFYQAALTENLKTFQPDELTKEIDTFNRSLQSTRHFRFGSAGFAFTLIFSLFVFGSMPDDTMRTLHFWSSYTQPNPYAFSITPADTTIEHGSTIQIGIQFEDNARPENVILEYKTDVEDGYRQRQMRLSENQTYLSPNLDLINSVSYRVEMDGFLSEEYTVNVQLQPRFDELFLTVTPPGYTGLSENRLEYPFSQVNLYPGSTLQIDGQTNKPVESLAIHTRADTIKMDGQNEHQTQFSATLYPESSDTLIFRMKDLDGLHNNNPFRTAVNVREDQYPAVVIQEPTGTVMKSEPEQIDIFYQATDDFGLTRAELHWEHQRAFVDQAGTGTVPLDRPVNGRTELVQWNLDEFELRPRDQLMFRIRVWDNDEISGYKWSESQQVIIQVPSLTEYFDDLDDRERDVQGELDEISESFRQMELEYEEFLERMRQNPDGGFEQEQMLEEVRDRQQSIDEAIERMNEQFEQIRSEIDQSTHVSEETQQAYRELQELMKELDDPALREAMEELQRALENMSRQELEQALENVQFNENIYRERLERTVELFKRLKMNSDLDKLASQYDDMAERIRNEEQTVDQLSNEMETIRQDLDNVSEQLEHLDSNPPRRSEERLKEIKEQGQQELENIREQLDQLMEEAGQQQENGGGESSPSENMQQQQQQISEQMQQESQRFRESIQQMSGQQIQVNILALQRALYTLLELSGMQEYLTQTSAETRSRSQGFVDLARVQNNVSNQFSTVADTLFQVSAELPGVPNTINRKKAEVERSLSRTMEEMVERNQRGATVTTRETLGGINDLTSMIASLIDQLMDQQNGDGMGGMSMQQMVEQLQNLSGDQQQLNQQLQDLINDAQGDRLSREQSERLDQIARQQNEIRRQLEELQRSGALEQGDRTLSELQRTIEEMEDSINDMRGGVTDPMMVQRQQNILSRMLNAEESLQQRGEDEEREGTRAQDYDRVLPPDITLEELQQEIRARMQDPNYTPFTEQYQRLIERYFEHLRRMEELQLP